MAGHWSRFATAPEMLHVMIAGSSNLLIALTVDSGQWTVRARVRSALLLSL
jgi:hypothetical protein